jgi:hypothetical protein
MQEIYNTDDSTHLYRRITWLLDDETVIDCFGESRDDTYLITIHIETGVTSIEPRNFRDRYSLDPEEGSLIYTQEGVCYEKIPAPSWEHFLQFHDSYLIRAVL